MTLTPAQIKIIGDQVVKHRITLPTLQDDLVDHLCCSVEKCMEDGNSFEESLQQALLELCPGGLYKIQRETDYLLSSEHLITMKKLTYLIGSLSAMAMSFGWLLRILGMGELGNAVFAFGALGFASLFLPMLVFNYFKDNVGKPRADKFRFAFGAFSAMFIAMGFLAKIMHLPGADEVLWIGGSLFTFGFLPFFFFSLYRKSVSRQKSNEE